MNQLDELSRYWAERLWEIRPLDGEDWWLVAEDEADALEVAKTMDIVDGYRDEERDLYPVEPTWDESGCWKVTSKISEWIAVSKRGDLIAASVF